jgi:hypothetical protein
MALLYMENADQNKYGSVIKGLMDQFSLNQDQYPKTINHATNVLSNHKFNEKFYENRKKNQDEKKTKDDQEGRDPPKEINFAQLKGTCYCCGKKGHHNPKCPEKNKDKKDWAINKTREAAFIQSAVTARTDSQSVVLAPAAANQEQNPFRWMACSITLGQLNDSMRHWVLIDTASTVNFFCSRELVRNVRKAVPLTVHTNAGTFTVQEKATLPWCNMEVWFDPRVITNVLSFAIIQEKFPVTYDNAKQDAFVVKTSKGDLVFKPLSKNLYVYKPKNGGGETKESSATNMLNTLKENKTFFTNQQVERARQARNLARALGCPSDADLTTEI